MSIFHLAVTIGGWAYLRVQMIAVAVTEPKECVVAPGQRVRGHPRAVPLVLPAAVAARDEASDLPGRSQVELNPLIGCQANYQTRNVSSSRSLSSSEMDLPSFFLAHHPVCVNRWAESARHVFFLAEVGEELQVNFTLGDSLITWLHSDERKRRIFENASLHTAVNGLLTLTADDLQSQTGPSVPLDDVQTEETSL